MINSSNKIIISIEGNIGVGKTTFIDILKSKFTNCDIVYEPVDIWKQITDLDGKNILQTFYENIPRWGYSFQNLAYLTRMMKIEDTIKNSNSKYIFLDRSLGTDKNVFEKMLYDNGQLNELEHSMYNLWCDFYHKYIRSQNNIIYIYLHANSETCMKRIKKRNRIEEENIKIDYLEKLNEYHDSWLLNDEMKDNVVVIDCNEEFETNEKKQEEMINLINSKFNKIFINNKIIIENESDIDNNRLFIFDYIV